MDVCDSEYESRGNTPYSMYLETIKVTFVSMFVSVKNSSVVQVN